ncbi:protein of unknown function DUF1156 [Oceanithermus profundus DSM 14977]|uniref:DUF1156 domain-containing protein n=2 Tax=Oceanithermus profundus TaxID=187137 RepID=E4UAG4_OCEP5|nr:protein of unknown function DUF1156 [Oceanithermus profundus DSM 14977]
MVEAPARKKLIEVALPLEDINEAARREKSIRHGHPSTLHLWWARRPLAAARAVIFAQMVDDPSSWPELFDTEEKQHQERERLFGIIRELVKWENTTNEEVLEDARAEIWRSWQRTANEWRKHIEAKKSEISEEEYQRLWELFDPSKLPAFHDPFAGGGALPLEAQRLGLEAYASDLNPVAVLINKAMIEIPPKFAGRPPVNPKAREDAGLFGKDWSGAKGLAEDVRYYGQWMRDEAEKRIGYLYPKVKITPEMVAKRPDLKPYENQELTVIAWLWARTVKSPNPAFAHVEVPLVSSFVLSSKKGKEAWVEPVIEGDSYRFEVRVGEPPEEAKKGTKLGRGAHFKCLLSGSPIEPDYIKSEGRAGRMGARLLAIVVEGNRERVYISPLNEHEAVAKDAKPGWKPDVPIPPDPRALWTPPYGLTTFGDLFTPRQLVALTTFSDLVQEARAKAIEDARKAGLADDSKGLNDGGTGATAYGDAISIFLAFALDKCANLCTSLTSWMSDRGAFRETFARQAIPMVWDYAEANPFSNSGGNFISAITKGSKVIAFLPATVPGIALQKDASIQNLSFNKTISTDPPYFDNIGYADLSDFFYVWLRRSLKGIYPGLFATVATPKAEELVATPYRHGGKDAAEKFFLEGMKKALHNLAEQAHPAFPITIYYAFKQSKTQGGDTSSTGWETFLEAVMQAGLSIDGTWPLNTEGAGRIVARDTNALASSIVLVCRRRPANAAAATRQEFLRALRSELPAALRALQAGNIAPVDLAQASIGPGMAVYTRYREVLAADGSRVSVRDALALINQVLDEVLAEQEGEYDAATRWAVAWFEQSGFGEGEFGTAETLSKAKNIDLDQLVQAGLLKAERGKVRLLRPDELPEEVSAEPTAWEMLHRLIYRLSTAGEKGAGELLAQLGGRAEASRELAYRLYQIAERKGWAQDALGYNALVQSWPEVVKAAQTQKAQAAAPKQEGLYKDGATQNDE